MNLNITTNYDPIELQKFVLTQPQLYPAFDEWVFEKLTPRLISGKYSSIVIRSEKNVVGNLIYNELDSTVEIKNFRIDETYRNIYLGKMLLQIALNLGKELITDISVRNFSAVQFFLRNNFIITGMNKLYSEEYEYLIRRSKN